MSVIDRQRQSVNSVNQRLNSINTRLSTLQSRLSTTQQKQLSDFAPKERIAKRRKKNELKDIFGNIQQAEKERREVQRLYDEEKTRLDDLMRKEQIASQNTPKTAQQKADYFTTREKQRSQEIRALNRQQKAKGLIQERSRDQILRFKTNTQTTQNISSNRSQQIPGLQSQLSPTQFNQLQAKYATFYGPYQPAQFRPKEQNTFLDRVNLQAARFSADADKESRKGTAKGAAKELGFRAASFALAAPQGVVDIGKGFASAGKALLSPIKTSKKIAKGTQSVLSDPTGTREKVLRGGAKIGEKARSSEPFFYGGFVADAATGFAIGKGVSLTAKGIGESRRVAQTIGKPKIDAEDIFSNKALAGEKFPKVSSTEELNKMLSKADNVVVTASPSKLETSFFTRKGIAGDSRKSAKGLEDPGIYVAPRGQGNPFFLRLQKSQGPTEYTFSPSKIFRSIKQDVSVPSITQFDTTGSVTPPRKVTGVKGFGKIEDFQKDIVGTGKVAVTKRGLIGRGEIPSQGDKGTGEIEFVIPKGQTFRDKGVIGSVRVPTGGFFVRSKAIPLRKADLDVLRRSDVPEEVFNLFSKNRRGKGSSSSSGISTRYRSPNFAGFYRSGSGSSSNVNSFSGFSLSGGSSGSGSSPFPSSPLGSSGGSSGGGSSPFPSSPLSSSGGSSGGSSSPFPSSPLGSSGGSSGGVSSPLPSFPSTSSNNKRPFRVLEDEKKEKKTRPAYQVIINRKGSPSVASNQLLPLNKARSLGADIVDNRIARSFDLVKKGRTTQKDTNFKDISDKFRPRKTKNALRYVEKRKFALDTPGEVRGIKSSKRDFGIFGKKKKGNVVLGIILAIVVIVIGLIAYINTIDIYDSFAEILTSSTSLGGMELFLIAAIPFMLVIAIIWGGTRYVLS